MTRQWNYLASDAFQVRYFVAAGLLRKYQNILEIGSYKTPVFQFLDGGDRRVLGLDPMVLDESKSDAQYSVALDYRCLSMPPFGGEPFALVILGFDLPDTPKLRTLLQSAEIAIIEFPEDAQWTRSRQAFDTLRDSLRLNTLLKLHLDLDGNDFGENDANGWPPRTQRYIHVLSSRYARAGELVDRNPFCAPARAIDTSSSALIDPRFTEADIFPDAAFEFSHGASSTANYLGGGLLYYTIAYMQRARVCVCLGSGGAFVPRLMRQAQRDIGYGDAARTILVDGDIGNYGRPNWRAADAAFRQKYPDVEIRVSTTADAARAMAAEQLRIDYLHIDADHSLAGCLADFNDYLPLMRSGALVTLHDTRPDAHPNVTCWQAVEEIRAMGHEVVNLDQLGSGVAIIKVA